MAATIGWLAWGLWLAALAISALGIVFLVLSASTPIPPRFGFRGADVIFALSFSTVGAVVTGAVPRTRSAGCSVPAGWWPPS